jgi:L-2-hydroxyglutarate oxidase LhgO
MIDGNIEAGPNAVLAFKKEGYKFFDFDFNETMQTLMWPGLEKLLPNMVKQEWERYTVHFQNPLYKSIAKINAGNSGK